ncbi:aldehyde dehydrogenase family protein [Allokutzneria oryzae]|uniref:Aldehyde dehydrogenase family protein n=1 Tax=Allokutzneria oryzae TaxID=1378989 RepID=A0ABV6A797_9PSEU
MTEYPPRARNWIDGAWCDSARTGNSVNPATGEIIGRYADGGAEEARAAIAAARTAFETTGWRHDRERRAGVLLELADRLAARREEVITLLARENGKTVHDAAIEFGASVPKLRYFAAMALTDAGRSAEVAPGLHAFSLREPAGVAGVIVPWNSPVVLAVRSLAPALAAGCTAVVKMPAQTALTNHLVAEIVASVRGLPAGAVNIFTESADAGARELVASPDVDVLSYTGSSAVGRVIAANAAATLKPVSLELGGKSPMLVFADADLDAVVPVLVKGITTFAGQFCMAGSRVLADAGVADPLRERLVAALERVRVGPGEDPASEMGAMIDRANVARVDEVVARAATYGTVLTRGGPVESGPLAEGAFFRPSLVEVADTGAPIVQEEVFGPVGTFEVFHDEADAVRRANATRYGLAASIWTRDVDRPRRVGRDLRVGTVWTNTWGVIADQFEEGGVKQSGLGRLNGVRGLEEFQETKTYLHRVTGC